jgi:hypothetical protein
LIGWGSHRTPAQGAATAVASSSSSSSHMRDWANGADLCPWEQHASTGCGQAMAAAAEWGAAYRVLIVALGPVPRHLMLSVRVCAADKHSDKSWRVQRGHVCRWFIAEVKG